MALSDEILLVWFRIASSLGTGHYLSPGGGGDGGVEEFRGDNLILRRTKRGSVVTENPKGGIAENFERIQRGTTQICLENKDMGGGGTRKSSKVIRGDHLSEVPFKGEIG